MTTPKRTEAETLADHWAAVVAGLRELADFIESTTVPVPKYPSMSFSAGGDDGDEASIERVREMADALGVEVDHDGKYWRADRQFGPVKYGCSYVERAEMASYNAALSYQGSVESGGTR